MKILCKNRINVSFESSEILLDPTVVKPEVSSIFVSHAHYDHLPKSRKKPLKVPPTVCSKATARLFKERIGYDLNQKDSWENDEYILEALPGGHTFDSTVAKITNKENGEVTVYTGDVNLEDRAYLTGFKPIKCNTLILEATWGDKNYRFPPYKQQVRLAREYIQNQLEQGNPVALLGYALGKAQLLNYSFGDLCEERFSSNSIWKMEQTHVELGLDLHPTKLLNNDQLDSNLGNSDPWLLFYSNSGRKDKTLAYLKEKYNLKVIGFSGWARNQERYKYQMGADAAFVVSDHSDYDNLLQIIKRSSPEKVFTVFGEANVLARELQKDGINAVPLKKGQATLESFF